MMTRRQSLAGLATASLGGLAGPASAALPSTSSRPNFNVSGIFLNAAFTHPLPLDSAAAAQDYLAGRCNPAAQTAARTRNAKALFASLINANPHEIAGIPSTSFGESFVAGSLGLFENPSAGIVSDILHYEGGLYTYGELAKRGAPFTIVPATPDGRIDMNQFESAVVKGVRLVAVSFVSWINGFEHDLKTVCEIAHRKGALVYVDAIQGLGAVPLDVKATGVDFLACASFKWLMGDFGYGFLYCREDRLPLLQRAQFGYHQIGRMTYNPFPGQTPAPLLFEAAPNNDSATGYFELGTMGTAAEMAVQVSLSNIQRIGAHNIQAQRQPLMDRLRDKLSAKYRPMTPEGSRTGIITFEAPDARRTLADNLAEAGIRIQLYQDRFRVSPSIYNTMEDIDALISTLT